MPHKISNSNLVRAITVSKPLFNLKLTQKVKLQKQCWRKTFLECKRGLLKYFLLNSSMRELSQCPELVYDASNKLAIKVLR